MKKRTGKKWLSALLAATLVMLMVPGMAYAGQGLMPAGQAAEGQDAPETTLAEQASAKKDIMLGVFFNSATDWTNSIYASYDGETLCQVAEVYKGGGIGKPYSGNHYAQYDPSIIYYGGYFWSLSGWNKNDGKIWLMISYSKDLVHWTHPEGNFGGNGIAVDSYPVDLKGKTLKKFDTVAPEWSVASDGSVYIIVSAGYYGDFHGNPTKDAMQAYSIKVDKLSASDGYSAGDGYLWPNGLTFKAGKAKKLSFTNSKKANFIDGALYAEGGANYLVIKKDGLTNQLYKNSNANNPKGWKLVNGKVSFGYEGPSIAKVAGSYFLFGDHVSGTTADGVESTSSKSLTTKKAWPAFHQTSFLSSKGKLLGARHGSVITLKAGTAGWTVAKKLLDQKVKAGTYAAKTSISNVKGVKKAFSVTWAAQSGVAKYQVRYSLKGSMSGATVVNASKAKNSKKVSGLKAGKKYYVQVRTVRQIGDVTKYSAWSKKKAVKTTK